MSHTPAPDVSVVIPVRDRSGPRLDNCLASLAWQDVDPRQIEVIVSDLGSDAHHLPALRRLTAERGVRLVEAPAPGPWNRSKALNVGIQAARGTIVLCTDADMIFQQNFLSAILEVHERRGGAVMALCRCWDLPASVPERQWRLEDYFTLKATARLRETSGTGACQAARRVFFEHGRGYDEKLRYWGFEDGDLVSRARRYGLELHWVSDRTSMLHQWHQTRKHDRPFTVHLNRLRQRLTRHIIVKNRGGWGTR